MTWLFSLAAGNNQGRSKSGRGGFRNDSARGRDGEGRGSSYDDLGEACGSNMPNAAQDQAHGGSSTFTKRSGKSYPRGSTIIVK